MSAAQIVLTLVIAAAAFAAGWAARGPASRREPASVPVPARRPEPDPADDGRDRRAALEEAAEALPAIIDQWLDDRGGPSPDAWPKLGRFDRAVAVLDEAGDRLPPETAGALREARDCLQRYREGLALDAETSRRLGAVEEALEGDFSAQSHRQTEGGCSAQEGEGDRADRGAGGLGRDRGGGARAVGEAVRAVDGLRGGAE